MTLAFLLDEDISYRESAAESLRGMCRIVAVAEA